MSVVTYGPKSKQSHDMKFSMEISTSTCFSDLRNDDIPGATVVVVDGMVTPAPRTRTFDG